jgi:carbon storage regulator CsrA
LSQEKAPERGFFLRRTNSQWCPEHLRFLLSQDWGVRSTASNCVVFVPAARLGKDDPVMLVLSRRLNEKILLPNTRTSVQVVSIKPGVVRLGIDAPPDVTILREELQTPGSENPSVGPMKMPRLLDQVREQLTAASKGLGLLQLQLDTQAVGEARATLAGLREALQTLRFAMDSELEPAVSKPPKHANRMTKTLPVVNDGELIEEFEGQLCGV